MHGYIDCGHLALQLIVLDFNSTGLLVLLRDQQCNAHAIRRQTKYDQYAINKAISTNAVSKNFNCRSCFQALQRSRVAQRTTSAISIIRTRAKVVQLCPRQGHNAIKLQIDAIIHYSRTKAG
jgi:hypothetical protein